MTKSTLVGLSECWMNKVGHGSESEILGLDRILYYYSFQYRVTSQIPRDKTSNFICHFRNDLLLVVHYLFLASFIVQSHSKAPALVQLLKITSELTWRS